MSREPDLLPVVHPLEEPPDELHAAESEDAVMVQQWHQHKAIAIGNEEKQEWLIAENAYPLWMMR